jgi:hypothetical protein
VFLTLGACDSQAGTTSRGYAQHYPGRHHTDANVLRQLEQRLRETGSVAEPARVKAGPQGVRTSATDDAIITYPLRISRARKGTETTLSSVL